MLSLLSLEVAIRRADPLKVRGSVLLWVATGFDSALGPQPVRLRCLSQPDRVMSADAADLELAPAARAC